MSWNEYESIWKSQELPRGADADLLDLKQTFEAKRRKMESTIQLRNVIEGAGGFTASIGFGFLTWRLGIACWPIVLGLILISGVSCVFLQDWWRFQRERLGAEAPMLAKLEANIAELRKQRKLIDGYGKWYVTPWVIAILLIGYGLSQLVRREAAPGLLITLLTTPATLAWIIVLISVPTIALVWWWRDIRKIIRLRIDPRLTELEKLRRDLLSSE